MNMIIKVIPRAAQSIKKDRLLFIGSAGTVDNPIARPAKKPPMFEKLSTLHSIRRESHRVVGHGHYLPWKQIKDYKSESCMMG